MWTPTRFLRPAGRNANSPAIHRWVQVEAILKSRSAGRLIVWMIFVDNHACAAVVPQGGTANVFLRAPSDESLGYWRRVLPDANRKRTGAGSWQLEAGS